MSLTNLFRIHAIIAGLYAISLLLMPQITLGLLSPQPINGLGVDITRIFGAALVLIALITWGASGLKDSLSRRMIASSLMVYTGLGAVICLVGQLAGNWGPLGWSNIIVYGVFALGYAYFLFGKAR